MITAAPDARQACFEPVVRSDARLLLLGSFPGVASLSAGQYYAHPRNQFWPIVGRLVGIDLVPLRYEDRLARLREARIALWDVVATCRRRGSLDADIRDAQSNAFETMLARAPALAAVGFNGATAARHAEWFATRGFKVYALPSTSPAHARIDADAKWRAWSVLNSDGWIARS